MGGGDVQWAHRRLALFSVLSLLSSFAPRAIERGHLRQAIEEKKLRARIIGRGWRVKKDDLDAYVRKLERIVMMEEDRRSDGRVRLALEVRWQGDSGSDTGRCGDISRRGCHVDSTAPVPVGGRICVEIRLAAGHWLPLCGEVVNHQPGAGFSIRFEDLPATSREMLAHLIDYFREGQSMSW